MSSTVGMTVETDNTQTVPDLSDILSAIDFNKKPVSHAPQGAKRSRFSVGKWGSLIIELVAYPNDREAILEEFGLTPYQLSELMANPIFQAVYKETESSIVALASNGGYQLSQRRLSEQGLNVLEEILVNGDDKDRLKAIELSATLGNLNPAVQAKMKEQQAVSTGVQLVVNFNNQMPVPKAFQQGKAVVIDAEVAE